MELLKHKLQILFKDLRNICKYISNLNRKTFLLFIKTPFAMRHICLYLNGKFYIKDGNLLLEITKRIGKDETSLTFHIKNSIDIFTIHEIFYVFPYAFSDAQNNYIVLDVGANIGDTALYFASYKNVDKVYAFEPFLKTYQEACANFALNKDISGKIEIFNFGVSNAAQKELRVKYSDKSSISMNAKDSEYNSKVVKGDVETVSIELKSVDYIFKHILPILSSPPPREARRKILLKIDCEGGEYEIFEAMDESNLFENLDIIMLEHHKGRQSLLDILAKHSFVSFPLGNSEKQGLIFAVKRI
ncbi:MAG: FkbM family methyltransferase [Elusimicrobiota bacterium]|jgi:FkbM family methyltransferase|nr:FkbM family methyltransferase [Elusimicrobiota bacterium]